MWWTNTLRTSANEDLGTLAEYDPLTHRAAGLQSLVTKADTQTRRNKIVQMWLFTSCGGTLIV